MDGVNKGSSSTVRMPPVRLCCMERHWGVLCADKTFMCALCFDKFPAHDAWRNEDNIAFDCCVPCKVAEAAHAKGSSISGVTTIRNETP